MTTKLKFPKLKEPKMPHEKAAKKLSIPSTHMSAKKIPNPKAKGVKYHKVKEMKLPKFSERTSAAKHHSGWM